MRSQKLTTVIFIGMVLGVLVGYACHTLWPDPQTATTVAQRDQPRCELSRENTRGFRSWMACGIHRMTGLEFV